MKNIICIFSMLGISIPLFAQDFSNAIRVGDKIPDIIFNNVINANSRKIRLSDYRGKFVILDFWNLRCSSCIDAFPDMQNLQDKFGDKIQIFLVNRESEKNQTEAAVKIMLDRIKATRNFYPKLPIPLHDTILLKYFPNKTVPHEVWIDKDGIVVAITNIQYVTEQNINSFLSGKKISLPLKDDWGFDRNKPFLIDGNGSEDQSYIYRTILTGYKSDLTQPEGLRATPDGRITGMYIINATLRSLIVRGFKTYLNPDAKLIFEVKNPDKYKNTRDASNMYCYDVSFPPIRNDSGEVMDYLNEDLKRYFNISVTREKRMMKSFVFTSHKNVASIKTKYNKPDARVHEQEIKKYWHNIPFKELWEILKDYIQYPIVNETGITDNVDIDFPDDLKLSDSDGILEFLRDSGYNIKEEERETEVLVVRD